jgi:hypothetical protein
LDMSRRPIERVQRISIATNSHNIKSSLIAAKKSSDSFFV